MAIFDPAFKITLEHEGGYSFDRDDPGGETYKGVSRRFHGEWSGWPVIDQAKKDTLGFPDNLDDDTELQLAVRIFYYQNFWKPQNCEFIHDQVVANKLFDIGVDCGMKEAAMMLQEALCYCGLPVKVDGAIGERTLQTLNMCNSGALIGEYKELIKEHYQARANKDRKLMKYLRGWINRAES